MIENVANFDSFLFKYLKVGTENFYGQRGFQAGERFVDSIFGGLRVIKNDAGMGLEFSLDVFLELGFVTN